MHFIIYDKFFLHVAQIITDCLQQEVQYCINTQLYYMHGNSQEVGGIHVKNPTVTVPMGRTPASLNASQLDGGGLEDIVTRG